MKNIKGLSKAILTVVAVLTATYLIYYYTDFFYPNTKINITEEKSEVVISRLTSKEELETIKTKLNEKGIVLDIEKVTYSGSRIKDIAVHITTPFGSEGSFSATNMRFIRHFSIVVDNSTNYFQIGNTLIDDLVKKIL